jgi:glycerophosphoryl diester phosphodiesterase
MQAGPVCVTMRTMSEPLQLVAHRGYAARYPENTEVALRAAVEAGARLIEFDVQLTRDGIPVLLHDDNFTRTAGHPAYINEIDFAALADFNVGETARLGTGFSGTPVCSLQRLTELLAEWPEVTAFVELKRQSLASAGVEAVFDAVLPVLQPVLDQCVIISFVADALRESRRRCAAPVGWAVRTWNEQTREQAAQLAPEYLFCNVQKLPADSADVWQGPWQWVIYEITDPDQAVELAGRGMPMIETMQFVEMQAALSKRGLL